MAHNSKCRTAGTQTVKKRDPRFYQLLDLASEGVEEAIHDLWVEFQYDFTTKGHGDE